MSIQTLDDVKETIFNLQIELSKTEKDSLKYQNLISELLDLRGELLAKITPVLNVVEQLELDIKALDLKPKVYGVEYQLKVVASTTTEILDQEKIYDVIVAEGENPLEYFKLQTSSNYIKNLLDCYPDTFRKVEGTKRHTFLTRKK